MGIRRGTARALIVFVVAVAFQVAVRTPAEAFEPGAEADFLARVNALRATVEAPPLAMDAKLTGVARDWSVQMSDGTGLAHNPNLRSIIDGLTSVWRKLGENVGYGSSVDQLHDALVHSPHHYANLVDPDFQFVGIGVVIKDGTMWVTQDFLAGPTSGTSSPPTTAAPARPRPTTTTVAQASPPRPTPAGALTPPPVVVLAPPAVPPPPPPIPERVRLGLETEQLLERLLRLPVAPGSGGRAL